MRPGTRWTWPRLSSGVTSRGCPVRRAGSADPEQLPRRIRAPGINHSLTSRAQPVPQFAGRVGLRVDAVVERSRLGWLLFPDGHGQRCLPGCSLGVDAVGQPHETAARVIVLLGPGELEESADRVVGPQLLPLSLGQVEGIVRAGRVAEVGPALGEAGEEAQPTGSGRRVAQAVLDEPLRPFVVGLEAGDKALRAADPQAQLVVVVPLGEPPAEGRVSCGAVRTAEIERGIGEHTLHQRETAAQLPGTLSSAGCEPSLIMQI